MIFRSGLCHLRRLIRKIVGVACNRRIAATVTRRDNGSMAGRRIYDDELHAQFVSFSCYRRRRLLDHPRAKQVVMGVLAAELNKHATGSGVRPDTMSRENLSVCRWDACFDLLKSSCCCATPTILRMSRTVWPSPLRKNRRCYPVTQSPSHPVTQSPSHPVALSPSHPPRHYNDQPDRYVRWSSRLAWSSPMTFPANGSYSIG